MSDKALDDFGPLEGESAQDEEKEIGVLKEQVSSLKEEVERLKEYINQLEQDKEKALSPPLIEAVVMDVLPNGRAVVKSSSGPNLVVYVTSAIGQNKLKPGDRVALNQRGSAIVELLPRSEDTFVKLMEVVERPKVTYADIGGLQVQMQLLREAVELPLKKPELFREIGIEPPKAVLLYGPPGCGKTMLVKAVAHEADATFIRLVGSELVQKFVGEGARLTRELFDLAKKKSPSIIFIDEIDAVASKRLDASVSGEREVQRTLMQLLAEIDGFDPLGDVKIIGATNRLDILDPAILRPGRFDRLVEVPLPDKAGREEILNLYLKKIKLNGEVDMAYLISSTEGMSGADLKELVTEAGMNAIRRGAKAVNMNDLKEALAFVRRKEKGISGVGYL
ncbi:MAG TPA: AAA family ATPase [Thermoprotei archaeon]|nr:proteasome-activating nucleotidase [TACK group archaeon]HEV51686.1 AAA family ATPase [Thermoprotei archaeon]